MVDAIVDIKTGKVTFPKPESKEAKEAAVSDMWYCAIPKVTLGKLGKLAAQDGFKPDAETDKGKANQLSKAARTYVLLALDMYTASRGVA